MFGNFFFWLLGILLGFFCRCVLSFFPFCFFAWNRNNDVNELVTSWDFTMLQLSTKKKVAMQNGRLKFINAANIVCKILQIPCNMKGPIFHMAKCQTNSVVCFFVFCLWLFPQCSFFFVLQSSAGFLASPTATTTATVTTIETTTKN